MPDVYWFIAIWGLALLCALLDTYTPYREEQPVRGNINSAVAFAMIMKMSRLEKELANSKLSKAEKEEHLREIRSIRRDLSMPDLPDYNSTEFGEELRK